uniref:Uncharacterized protein n=1 Tax=Arundo donax TaxID=35708 RepID=A0A0A8XTF8_ARUDO
MWGKGRKESFVQTLKKSMAARGPGRNRGSQQGGQPGGDWGLSGGGGLNQFPHQFPPHPQFFPQPPPLASSPTSLNLHLSSRTKVRLHIHALQISSFRDQDHRFRGMMDSKGRTRQRQPERSHLEKIRSKR